MAAKIEHIAQTARTVNALPAADERKSTTARQREENNKVREAAAELNKIMDASNTKLTFVVDQELKKAIIKVVDAETNTVIRQIPSEDSVRVAQKISRLMGILYDGTH